MKTYNFSYDSSGHLTNFKKEGGSRRNKDYELTFTWSSDKITEITESDSESTLTLSSFEYSSKYPNVTLQYAPYIEMFFADEEQGFPMLFYLGYLGKASTYHPISFTCTYGTVEEYFYYKPTLNKDGSLKKMKQTEVASFTTSPVTYTFSYE